MISRTHRFHGHGSLRYVYQHGETIRGPQISLKFVHNDRQKGYRLAVVVSKKVSKSAVVRNHIRRRIYEQIRLLEPQITRPYDMVISVFHEQIAQTPTGELGKQLSSQLRQAKILAKPPTPVHGKIESEGDAVDV